MLDDGNFLGQIYWHLNLIYGLPSIFIYELIMEFTTLVNFGYLKLKLVRCIGNVNFGILDDANEDEALHKTNLFSTNEYSEIERYILLSVGHLHV